jgi:hypothetical protein
MEAAYSSETSADLQWNTQRYVPEDRILIPHQCESLNVGVVGSNPTKGMDVCVHLFCVCIVLCVGRGLATG